jgi:trehalose/maltose hydrolase-like predicted phosphorylase
MQQYPLAALSLSLSLLFSLILISPLTAQPLSDSPWHVTATAIDPANYYGVTVANGMVGLVSSPEPMQVQDVVLNGVYDYYQRGRVSNILKTFNHVNMNLDVDGRRVGRGDIQNYAQTLDIKRAALTITFDVGDKLRVEHTAYSLSPMGLSGLGYNGHVFWDTEIWMYPPLLMLQPDIARSLLEYHYERLGAALVGEFGIDRPLSRRCGSTNLAYLVGVGRR